MKTILTKTLGVILIAMGIALSVYVFSGTPKTVEKIVDYFSSSSRSADETGYLIGYVTGELFFIALVGVFIWVGIQCIKLKPKDM